MHTRQPRRARHLLWRILSAASLRRTTLVAAGTLVVATSALAQQPPQGIWRLGDAVVTGFPGTRALPVNPPLADPADKTVIDIDGPSVRIIDLSQPGGPPMGQLINAPKLFTATARQVGNVFAVALDDQLPANIYVAATSAYGLPIVAGASDPDGTPRRLRRGEPGARFMDGLFGPPAQGGGPGSIWRIDGRTGQVSLFANVLSAGQPNPGPGLGDLSFDEVSRQVFVADRHTGLIHRLSPNGADLGSYDHGLVARPVLGLPPVPYDPATRIDIASPAFEPGAPATWGYAAPGRRVFGLKVHQRRVYYAVAEPVEIWSVGIRVDGGFADDPRLETVIPPPQPIAGTPPVGPFEISDILFDGQGRMYAAERADPRGPYDYRALADPVSARTYRFILEWPDNPVTPVRWVQPEQSYAIGFPVRFDNGNGGIALGYGYTRPPQSRLNTTSCNAWLWTTGEQLRNTDSPAEIARLQQGGPLPVQGLQGNPIPLVRPQNTPPYTAYFADYDDRFTDPDVFGWMGDVEIWQVCGGRGAWYWFGDGVGYDWWRTPPQSACLAIATDWQCPAGPNPVLTMRVIDQAGYGFDTVKMSTTTPGAAVGPTTMPLGAGGSASATILAAPGSTIAFEVCAYREADRLSGQPYPCCKARFEVPVPWGQWCPPNWTPWWQTQPPPRLIRRGALERQTPVDFSRAPALLRGRDPS